MSEAGQSKRLRVAVIGLGGVSQSVHLPLLARRWDLFEIVALVDLSAQRVDDLATRYGVAGRFTALEDLLAAHASGDCVLDGAVVTTSGSHGPEVLALAQAGIPVFCEKPVALSGAEIDAIEAVDGALVQVAYMKEYDPATARAKAELEGKRIRAVDVEILHPTSDSQLVFAHLLPPTDDIDRDHLTTLLGRTEDAITAAVGDGVPAQWRNLYGGVLQGSLIHDISLLRHVMGGIESVESALRWGGEEGEAGSIEVSGTVAGGARLHVGWHYLPDYPDYRETVTFHHDSGSVSLVFGIPYLLNAPTVLTVVSRAGDEGEARAEYRWNQQEAFESELAAFHALVTSGAKPFSGTVEGRADLEVAQAIHARLGARHTFPVGGECAAR